MLDITKINLNIISNAGYFSPYNYIDDLFQMFTYKNYQNLKKVEFENEITLDDKIISYLGQFYIYYPNPGTYVKYSGDLFIEKSENDEEIKNDDFVQLAKLLLVPTSERLELFPEFQDEYYEDSINLQLNLKTFIEPVNLNPSNVPVKKGKPINEIENRTFEKPTTFKILYERFYLTRST